MRGLRRMLKKKRRYTMKERSSKKQSKKRNSTLPLEERKHREGEANVPEPSEEAIRRAKEWVDYHEV